MGGGGGGSQSYDDLQPKTQEQLNLENQFYALSDRIMQGMQTGNFNMSSPMYTQQQAAPAQQVARPSGGASGVGGPSGYAGPRDYQEGRATGIGGAWIGDANKQPTAAPSQQAGKGGKGGTQTGGGATEDNIGNLLNNAMRQQNTANGTYDSMLNSIGQANQGQMNALNNSTTAGNSSYANADKMYGQAQTARDPYDQRAMDAYDRAGGMIQQSENNANLATETNKWYDKYAQGNLMNANNLLETGNIPAELEARFMDTINRGMKTGMGSMLNDMASRGVVNSSLTGQGIDNLSKNAAQAFNDNYLDTFNSVLGGYQNNASVAGQTGKNLADTYLNINNNLNSGAQTAMGLGDSLSSAGSQKMQDYTNLGNAYQGAGSQRIADQLGIAQGYGNAAAGQRSQMDGLMNDIPKYWQNALAGFGLPLGFLEQMQKARGQDTKTTVVEQGGKK